MWHDRQHCLYAYIFLSFGFTPCGEGTVVSIVSCRCAYCCSEPIHRKIIWRLSSYFVVAICYVQTVNFHTISLAWRKTATTLLEYITVQGVGSGLLVVKALTQLWTIDREGVARRLAFFTHSGSCNLLYALFIFKHVRHTCCLLLHVYVHCIACNCMLLYVPRWLSSNHWANNPPW